MTTIDPTKKTFHAPPPDLQPKASDKPTAQAKQPAVNLDYQVQGPKTPLAGLFPPKPPKLEGQGVSGAVFGDKTPNLKGMTDAELAKAMDAQGAAIRAAPGKVNDYDLQLRHAMFMEAGTRYAAKLDAKVDPKSLGNADLFARVVTFDLAAKSGLPMTPEQKTAHAKLEAEWNARVKADGPSGSLSDLQARRAELRTETKMHCTAALGYLASAVGHQTWAGDAASGALIEHSLHKGEKGHAAEEAALVVLGKYPNPVTHKVVEGISFGIQVAQFIDHAAQLRRMDDAGKK